jgi:hypothetical protein
MLARQIVESHYDLLICRSTENNSTDNNSTDNNATDNNSTEKKKRSADAKKRTAKRAISYLADGKFLKDEVMDAQVNASVVF